MGERFCPFINGDCRGEECQLWVYEPDTATEEDNTNGWCAIWSISQDLERCATSLETKRKDRLW